ncbi:MAG: hypothetical protein M0R76_01490 [Proteobacteria bacterium]|nr:hypothetical protein [Pseudomonadota bacterium]
MRKSISLQSCLWGVLFIALLGGMSCASETLGDRQEAASTATPQPATAAPEASEPTAAASDATTPPLSDFVNAAAVFDQAGRQMALAGDDECCKKPGQADECWERDAIADGALCTQNADCKAGQTCDLSGTHTNGDTSKGFCTCDTNDDCIDLLANPKKDGICATRSNGDRRCGPSWCNGYYICSCWGGCTWWDEDPYRTPNDDAAELGLVCCDGYYPVGGKTMFFDKDCTPPNPECLVDSDCDDGSGCTINICDTVLGKCLSTPRPAGTECDLDGLACTRDICNDTGVCEYKGPRCPKDTYGPDLDNTCTEDCVEDPTDADGDGKLYTCYVPLPYPSDVAAKPHTGRCDYWRCAPAGSSVIPEHVIVDCTHKSEDACNINWTCDPTKGPKDNCNLATFTLGAVCATPANKCRVGICQEDNSDPLVTQAACIEIDVADPEPDPNAGAPNNCKLRSCKPASGWSWDWKPDGTPCDDGVACTIDDQCYGGSCEGTENCPAIGQCFDETCNHATGLCERNNFDDSVLCDDNDVCTNPDHCDSAGSCYGVPTSEPALLPNICYMWACDSVSGWSQVVDSGALCDDSDLCTENDVCDPAGNCVGTPIPKPTDPADPCMIWPDVCDPTTGWQMVPDPGSGCVDDGDLCTDDMCDVFGDCVHPAIPKPSTDPGECMKWPDDCDPATGWIPVYDDGIDCTDNGDLCTENVCDSGACTHPPIPKPSSYPGECMKWPDTCDPATGWVPVYDDGASCATDGNLCTENICQSGVCTHPPTTPPTSGLEQCRQWGTCDPATGLWDQIPDAALNGTTCSDGIACTGDALTGDDVCQDGYCVGSDNCDIGECYTQVCDMEEGKTRAQGCQQTNLPDGTPCPPDADLCTNDLCDTGACIHPPIPKPADPGECLKWPDVCDPTTGWVVENEDGIPCTDDGNACTENICAGGACTHPPVDCDDSDLCTVDDCDPDLGCLNIPLDCDDGNACTADSCDPATGCVNTSTIDCDDNDACTVDSCDTNWGCVNDPFDDPSPLDTADPANQCLTRVCDSATGWQSVNKPDGTTCNDNDLCTENDVCTAGVCGGTPTADPAPADPLDCWTRTCVPASGWESVNKTAGTPCDDHINCTNPDVCNDQGQCIGTPDCPDATVCSMYQCHMIPFVADPCDLITDIYDGDPCNDGDACTAPDTCLTGVCQGPPHSDPYPWQAGQCEYRVCDSATGWGNLPLAAGTLCDDGNACTDPDECDAFGVCQSGGAVADLNPPVYDPQCQYRDCLPSSGWETLNRSAGTLCDDNDACTEPDQCDSSGVCQPGSESIDLDPSNYGQCEVRVCDVDLGWIAVDAPDGTPCDDGNDCTIDDECTAGVCAGTPDAPANDTCDGAIKLGDFTTTDATYMHAGTTLCANNDYWTSSLNCVDGPLNSGVSMGSKSADVVYWFSYQADNTDNQRFIVKVETDDPFDATVYLYESVAAPVGGCPSLGDVPALPCVSNGMGEAQEETCISGCTSVDGRYWPEVDAKAEMRANPAHDGTVYVYIVVDGSDGSEGDFVVSVERQGIDGCLPPHQWAHPYDGNVRTTYTARTIVGDLSEVGSAVPINGVAFSGYNESVLIGSLGPAQGVLLRGDTSTNTKPGNYYDPSAGMGEDPADSGSNSGAWGGYDELWTLDASTAAQFYASLCDYGGTAGALAKVPPTCQSGGKVFGDHCWYLSNSDQSCDELCTSKDLIYDQATRLIAGSDGTTNECRAILNASPVWGQSSQTPSNQNNAAGCYIDNGGNRARGTQTTLATDKNNQRRRVCACSEKCPDLDGRVRAEHEGRCWYLSKSTFEQTGTQTWENSCEEVCGGIANVDLAGMRSVDCGSENHWTSPYCDTSEMVRCGEVMAKLGLTGNIIVTGTGTVPGCNYDPSTSTVMVNGHSGLGEYSLENAEKYPWTGHLRYICACLGEPSEFAPSLALFDCMGNRVASSDGSAGTTHCADGTPSLTPTPPTDLINPLPDNTPYYLLVDGHYSPTKGSLKGGAYNVAVYYPPSGGTQCDPSTETITVPGVGTFQSNISYNLCDQGSNSGAYSYAESCRMMYDPSGRLADGTVTSIVLESNGTRQSGLLGSNGGAQCDQGDSKFQDCITKLYYRYSIVYSKSTDPTATCTKVGTIEAPVVSGHNVGVLEGPFAAPYEDCDTFVGIHFSMYFDPNLGDARIAECMQVCGGTDIFYIREQPQIGAGDCASGECTTNQECTNIYGSNKPFCQGGVCRQCATDPDCDALFGGTAPACVSGMCRECRDNTNCDGATPFCMAYTCRECAAHTDCLDTFGITKSRCDAGTCKPCNNDSQCPSNHPFCTSGVCTGCESDADCDATAPYCGTDNRCKQCVSDGHCTDPTYPFCINNNCAECATHTDCQALYGLTQTRCDAGTCKPCNASTQCPSHRPTCSAGVCTGCGDHSDCAAPTPACVANVCRECVDDGDCGGATPFCIGNTCSECADHSDCMSLYGVAKPNCHNGTCGTCTQNSHCPANSPICEAGTCTGCGDDGDCGDPLYPFCGSDSRCKECVSDTHCGGDTPHCVNETCQQCLVHADCTDPTKPSCNNGTCGTCFDNSDCPSNHPICEAGTCTGCASDIDCDGDTPFCNTGTHRCQECSSSADCYAQHGVSKTWCDGGTCKPCVYDYTPHCPSNHPFCESGTCTGCASDADCDGATPYCSSQRCKECTSHDHCYAQFGADKSRCDNGTCTPCLYDSECPQSTYPKCLSGTCGGCASDAQCAATPDTPHCINKVCKECSNHAQCYDKYGDAKPTCHDGTCGTCTNDAHCAATPYPKCISGSCGGCSSDAQCGGDTPYCKNNQCTECTEDDWVFSAQCYAKYGVEKTRCGNGTCTKCTGSHHCPVNEYPTCSATGCSGCATSAQCGGDTPYCLNNQCKECNNDHSHCVARYGGARAICDNGNCQPCSADWQCSNAGFPKCQSGVCTGCHNDSQCAAPTPYCVNNLCGECNEGEWTYSPTCIGLNPAYNKTRCNNGTCSQCNDSNRCPPNRPTCSSGTCTGCGSNADCSAPTPACVNKLCKECSVDADCPSAKPNCGADNTCSAGPPAFPCNAGNSATGGPVNVGSCVKFSVNQTGSHNLQVENRWHSSGSALQGTVRRCDGSTTNVTFTGNGWTTVPVLGNCEVYIYFTNVPHAPRDIGLGTW